MATAAAALDRLCDPEAEVSAHYVVTETGEILRLVPEDRRAWHAGAGRWGAVTDVNSRSIGIELVNPGAVPFAAAQMRALEALLADILHRHAIPPERVIGHSDMAPARKADPGPRFDWRRLALQDLSVWPRPTRSDGADPAALRAAMAAFGYAPDLADDLLLTALRLRFRPWGQGPLAPADLAVALDLAARFPVDRAMAGA